MQLLRSQERALRAAQSEAAQERERGLQARALESRLAEAQQQLKEAREQAAQQQQQGRRAEQQVAKAQAEAQQAQQQLTSANKRCAVSPLRIAAGVASGRWPRSPADPRPPFLSPGPGGPAGAAGSGEGGPTGGTRGDQGGRSTTGAGGGQGDQARGEPWAAPSYGIRAPVLALRLPTRARVSPSGCRWGDEGRGLSAGSLASRAAAGQGPPLPAREGHAAIHISRTGGSPLP